MILSEENKPSLDELAHHGVKGMKWGVRRATKITDRQLKIHKDALSGKGAAGLLAKVDKYTWGGGGRFEGYHKKRIAELENSKERIAAGDLVVRTLLFGPQYTRR